MSPLWLAFTLLLGLTCLAFSQTMHGVTDALTGGGSPIPPSCTNALDFSQACNSQYIPVALR